MSEQTSTEKKQLSWATPTVAELMHQQGHIDQALSIYQDIVQQNPQDLHAQQRLQQLQSDTDNPLQIPLTQIVHAVPGSVGCFLLGFDGIILASFLKPTPKLDLATLLAENALLAQQAEHLFSTNAQCGKLSQLCLQTDAYNLILRGLTSEYLVALVLQHQAYIGQAQFYLDKLSPALVLALD